ncbi:MAG TPA: S46 family peptidase [Bryobacteraceae bacterium]|nr:S46 family peptidase [Bryobacteraceae bacterium]
MRNNRFTARRLVVLALFLISATTLVADEGIWLFNHFPSQAVKERQGFEVTDRFLDQLRLGSVKFAGVASGSFVSPDGLLLTNHHVASECIQQLSTKENDYMGNGFFAASQAEERKCPDLEANVLLSIDDVTAAVQQGAPAGAASAEAGRTRRANMGRIEKDCTTGPDTRCEVVTLYSGGEYHLYRYKKYTDIRLVLAPEAGIAAFGGDPDNFTYPRYCLDMTFFRAYENDRPARTPDYLRWSKDGVKEGELIFVPGNPATTGRLNTVAQLEFFRDVSYPLVHARLNALVKALLAYSSRSPENKRVATDNLLSQQNSLKAYAGFLMGLRDPKLIELKRKQESELRAAVAKDPKLDEAYGKAWDRLAEAYKEFAEFYKPYWLLETAAARGSDLFRLARDVVRLAEEKPKPDGQRLREYRDAALPGVEASLYATIPITDSMEIVAVRDYLEFLRRSLGASDPTVRALLGGRSPQARAREFVSTSKLRDVAERKRLAESAEAVKSSSDGMIRLALLLDTRARELRKRYEDRVEAVVNGDGASVARARFAAMGAGAYPDATFTLRLSYGPVKGYKSAAGKDIPHATDFAGLYKRATGKEPFRLPARWVASKGKLNLATPFNFVSTADTHGGSSGSPTVNTKGEIVGVLFDGNLESLPDRFLYTDDRARSVHVSAQGIVEVLRQVYGASRVLKELGLE